MRIRKRQKVDAIALSVIAIACGLFFANIFGGFGLLELVFHFGISVVAATVVAAAWFSISGRQLRHYAARTGLAIFFLVGTVFLANLISSMLSGEDVTLAFGAAIGLLTGLILLFALNCFNAVLHYLE
jgi:uncharacterized membrane protein